MESQPAPAEDRRAFMKEAAAAVLGGSAVLVPAAAGVVAWLDPLGRRGATGAFVRVASLEAVPADGVPRRFPVLADKVDAWTRQSGVPVGAVYLRRMADQKLQALNVVCPHAGCFVDYQTEHSNYFCPCHNSTFAADGSINDPGSPSPRAMDGLEVEVRGSEVWVRFQNFQAGHKDKIPVA